MIDTKECGVRDRAVCSRHTLPRCGTNPLGSTDNSGPCPVWLVDVDIKCLHGACVLQFPGISQLDRPAYMYDLPGMWALPTFSRPLCASSGIQQPRPCIHALDLLPMAPSPSPCCNLSEAKKPCTIWEGSLRRKKEQDELTWTAKTKPARIPHVAQWASVVVGVL